MISRRNGIYQTLPPPPLFYSGTSKRDHNVRTDAPLGLEENRGSIEDEAIALKTFPRDYVYHLQYVKI